MPRLQNKKRHHQPPRSSALCLWGTALLLCVAVAHSILLLCGAPLCANVTHSSARRPHSCSLPGPCSPPRLGSWAHGSAGQPILGNPGGRSHAPQAVHSVCWWKLRCADAIEVCCLHPPLGGSLPPGQPRNVVPECGEQSLRCEAGPGSQCTGPARAGGPLFQTAVLPPTPCTQVCYGSSGPRICELP